MDIAIDDLTNANIIAFLQEHLHDMHATSPPESVHALDLAALSATEVTFWSVYSNQNILLGCGALKDLGAYQGEIKSMRTVSAARGTGVASTLLQHILTIARTRGYKKVFLETGSMAFFKPARQLYKKAGFTPCEPFADYTLDENSVFMTLDL
ncbi:GNAT family N-acetyltransferase [Teredinibacter purpureus]|uniref:GNAT family N-acetyltransferase n=1 Tax=Teredinibacter purpureus TaxID=2731756 RepID=UPI0005F80E74|nr:GNAT family N-acetyltransferase [Teredinibacter purpureus]